MKKIIATILAIVLVCSIGAVSAFAWSGNMPAVDGGMLNISEAGTYTLTGRLRGTVCVDPGAGNVILILDNVTVSGGDLPGILAMSGDSLTVSVKDGTANTVMDGSGNAQMGAAIFSKVDTIFEGGGSINIVGRSKDGIRMENADLTINGGRFEISAPDYGVARSGSSACVFNMNGGSAVFRSGMGGIEPGFDMIENGGNVQEMPWEGNNAPAMPDGEAPAMPDGEAPAMPEGEAPASPDGEAPEMTDGMVQPGVTGSADSAGEIVTGITENSAGSLTADMENAVYYTITDGDSQIIISSSGTYVVTGGSSDGNITVKKGTTGVILVLEDLDLTSTTGATLSVNKEAEVKLIISGDVILTDAENPEDEESEDEAVADAYDGAAIKIKANSQVYITGDGTLTINGNAKNGIKTGDDSSLVIDGATISITAANDGINANYDLAILSGTVTIEAVDDAIHADHILTIGNEDGTGPVINVTSCEEGLEATVVNIYGGDITVNSSDDAINAANKDGLYEDELTYSINMMGGKVTIKSNGDGMDSNGNINLIGGSATVSSATTGGEAGLDYDGQLYISDEFKLNNVGGVAGPDGMNGQFPGNMSGMEQNFGGQTPGMQDQSFNGSAPGMQNR